MTQNLHRDTETFDEQVPSVFLWQFPPQRLADPPATSLRRAPADVLWRAPHLVADCGLCGVTHGSVRLLEPVP